MASDSTSSQVEHWQRHYVVLSRRVRALAERLSDRTLPAERKQHIMPLFYAARQELAVHARRHPGAPQRAVSPR
jgi:hypothetical protein